MRTAVGCIALLGLLLATGSPLQAQSLIGTWTGPVTQYPAGKTPYRVVMTIGQTDAETDYPELNCGGRLTRAGAANGYVFFTESITRGRDRCIDGTVTIASSGTNLAWGWIGVFRGRTYAAWGTLTPK